MSLNFIAERAERPLTGRELEEIERPCGEACLRILGSVFSGSMCKERKFADCW